MWPFTRRPAPVEAPVAGIVLDAPEAVRWDEAIPAPTGIPGAPARPAPIVIVKGRYAFRSADLAAAGASTWSVQHQIHVFVHWPDGQTTGGSLQSLQRARFTADTGIHPSYATDPSAPDDWKPPEWIRGAFTADLGAILARPEGPIVLRIGAAFGPYRSEEVELPIQP